MPIDELPEVVEARSRIGDWEADTVRQARPLSWSQVERRSRLSLIALAPNKTAEAVKAAIVLQPPVGPSASLTYWQEFAYHMEIAKVLKADGYFVFPEPENTNAYPAVPVQGNRLQQTDGQAGPGDHGQVTIALENAYKTQLRDQTARCTLNPPPKISRFKPGNLTTPRPWIWIRLVKVWPGERRFR